MAISVVPSTWLGAGYSADSAGHTVAFHTNDAASDKTLVQLTDAKANAATGDVRNVFFALCYCFYHAWVTQLAANNRPLNINFSRSVSVGGGINDDITFGYTFRFVLIPGDMFLIDATPPTPSSDGTLHPVNWLGVGYGASPHFISFRTLNNPSDPNLPQLSDAKADETTGDVRQIMFAVCHEMWESWINQLTFIPPNNPNNMSIQRSVGPGTGTDDNLTYEFTFQFTVSPTGVFSLPAES
jgi:hypothetical protein